MKLKTGIIFLLGIILSSFTVMAMGVTYYDLVDVTDQWSSNDGVATGVNTNSSFPTFNISGDSSPNAGGFGAGADIDIPNTFGIFDGTSDFTIAGWFYADNSNLNDGVWSLREATKGPFLDMDSLTPPCVPRTYCVAIKASGSWVHLSTSHINSDQWYHIVYSFNTVTGHALYENGSLINSSADVNTFDPDIRDNIIGNDYLKGNPFHGIIDEIQIYNHTLNVTEVQNLYNYGNIEGTMPSVPSPVIDIIFQNVTDTKTTFDEGEDFFIWANYTLDNGTVLNDSQCNVSLWGGIQEQESIDDNFTMCSTCDHSQYIEEFDTHSNYTAINDTIRFYGCYEQLNQGDMEVNISCNGGVEQFIVEPLSFPDCNVGVGLILLDSIVCLTSEKVNVTITYDEIVNRRKRVEQLTLDREYRVHITEYPAGVYFNTTLEMFVVNHTHKYYKHGTKTISANCTNTNPSYTLSASETITIVNAPPIILLSGLLINQTIYPLNQSVPYQYFNNWVFLTTIIDDDVSLLNITLSNSSGLISSRQETYIFQFNESNDQFREFSANPFNLSVRATDIGGTVYFSVEFNISDTANPTCTGITDEEVKNNTNYKFNIKCYDESFYLFNISCSNGFNYYVDGLNTNKFTFINVTTILGETHCNYTFCDGHTANQLSSTTFVKKESDKIIIKTTKDKHRFNNTFKVLSSKGYNLSYKKVEDRIKINVKYPKDKLSIDKVYTYEFVYYTSDKSHYLPSQIYKGWIVDSDSRTWFDTNLPDDPKSITTVEKIDYGVYAITVTTTLTELKFESIGQLNCVQDTQAISIIHVSPFMFHVADCPVDNLQDTLLFIGFAILCFFIYLMSFTVNSPVAWIVGLITSAGIVYIGYVMFGCALFMGWLIVIIGFLLFIGRGVSLTL